ncbi:MULTISPECIES: hypothetical protein [unclassified Enterococcus]|jgi:hypothetical protein|uniref:hypothetical protein n=1 Tax=unclassified Enterococcus TaxID=2608891 RepID=UPI003D2A4889
MRKKHARIIDIIIILFMSTFYVLPLFLPDGVLHTRNQDTYFHLSRLIGLDNVWSSPVNFNNFGHNGTMMNIFYPWLTLYPAYLFYHLTNNLTLGYGLYYWFITVLTMLIAYYSMGKIKNNRVISLLFSIIYTFSAYRATDIFHRASLGEAVALTFLPFVLLGCYEIYVGNYKKWYFLTIGMTFIVYTHLLSVAMTAVLIAASFILTFYFWNDKMHRLVSLTKATILTILLSAGFLIPFIQQSFAQSLHVPAGKVLSGMLPADMLVQALNNNLASPNPGLLLLAGIIISIAFKKYFTNSDWFIFALGIIVIFCSTNLFPWRFFTDTPIDKLQFVWRLNTFTALFIAYIMSVAIFYGFANNKRNGYTVFSVILLTMFLHGSSIINLYTSNRENISTIPSDRIVEAVGNYHHTDYANAESMNHLDFVLNDHYTLNDEEIKPQTDFSSSEFTIIVNNPTQETGNLVTPLYRYKGQQVSINGKEASSTLSAIGTTEIKIPSGKNTIKISYRYDNLALAARYLSILTLIICLLYTLIRRIFFSK